MITKLLNTLFDHGIKPLHVFYFLGFIQLMLLASYRKEFRDWKNVKPYKKNWITSVIFLTLVFLFISFMETFFPRH